VKKRRRHAAEPQETGELAHRPFAELARRRLQSRRDEPPRSAAPVVERHVREPGSFAEMLRGVIPLPARAVGARNPSAAPPSAEVARIRGDASVTSSARVGVAEVPSFETRDDGSHVEGRRLDVDPRELRKLRRGVFVLDATLDLHGRSEREARAEVTAFIRSHALAGERLVRVIHGRGNHTPGGQGVLRGEIGAWLSQGASSRYVAAFVTAAPEQGGEGAVIVLLSRSVE
jgi:DNA-nicking Smr family endonuclease